jgi:hypothetical protein
VVHIGSPLASLVDPDSQRAGGHPLDAWPRPQEAETFDQGRDTDVGVSSGWLGTNPP